MNHIWPAENKNAIKLSERSKNAYILKRNAAIDIKLCSDLAVLNFHIHLSFCSFGGRISFRLNILAPFITSILSVPAAMPAFLCKCVCMNITTTKLNRTRPSPYYLYLSLPLCTCIQLNIYMNINRFPHMETNSVFNEWFRLCIEPEMNFVFQ